LNQHKIIKEWREQNERYEKNKREEIKKYKQEKEILEKSSIYY